MISTLSLKGNSLSALTPPGSIGGRHHHTYRPVTEPRNALSPVRLHPLLGRRPVYPVEDFPGEFQSGAATMAESVTLRGTG